MTNDRLRAEIARELGRKGVAFDSATIDRIVARRLKGHSHYPTNLTDDERALENSTTVSQDAFNASRNRETKSEGQQIGVFCREVRQSEEARLEQQKARESTFRSVVAQPWKGNQGDISPQNFHLYCVLYGDGHTVVRIQQELVKFGIYLVEEPKRNRFGSWFFRFWVKSEFSLNCLKDFNIQISDVPYKESDLG